MKKIIVLAFCLFTGLLNGMHRIELWKQQTQRNSKRDLEAQLEYEESSLKEICDMIVDFDQAIEMDRQKLVSAGGATGDAAAGARASNDTVKQVLSSIENLKKKQEVAIRAREKAEERIAYIQKVIREQSDTDNQ